VKGIKMKTVIPYASPDFRLDGFNCPFCHAFSKQTWGFPARIVASSNYGDDINFAICRCDRCGEFSTWINQKLVYPPSLTAPPPNPDIPEDIKSDFEEARAILSNSPRGASALLRLAIQKLCAFLGEKGKNINDDISSLVKKGLPIKVQQALDIVRVVGNNSVHPGQIDLKDDLETANTLFGLVNLIADVMITQPKHVEELYKTIVPETQREAINKRDSS
jgi:hypothetical protein